MIEIIIKFRASLILLFLRIFGRLSHSYELITFGFLSFFLLFVNKSKAREILLFELFNALIDEFLSNPFDTNTSTLMLFVLPSSWQFSLIFEMLILFFLFIILDVFFY